MMSDRRDKNKTFTLYRKCMDGNDSSRRLNSENNEFETSHVFNKPLLHVKSIKWEHNSMVRNVIRNKYK